MRSSKKPAIDAKIVESHIRELDPCKAQKIDETHLQLLFDDVMSRGTNRVLDEEETTYQRRPKRFVVAVIAGALVAGTAAAAVPAAAVINKFLAQTGIVSSGSTPGTESIPGAEWVNPEATDFTRYALSIYDLSLPLPSEYDVSKTAETLALNFESNASEPGETYIEDASIKRYWEDSVRCMWGNEVISASAAGDAAALTRAADVYAASAAWPALKATDGNDFAGFIKSAADAARKGNLAQIKATQEGSACTLLLAPLSK